MKMKNAFPAALGVLILLGVTVTAIAAGEKAPAAMERMTEKLITSPEEVGETITTTAQAQAVDLKKRQVTLKDKRRFCTAAKPV
jgi:hypothetical protein